MLFSSLFALLLFGFFIGPCFLCFLILVVITAFVVHIDVIFVVLVFGFFVGTCTFLPLLFTLLFSFFLCVCLLLFINLETIFSTAAYISLTSIVLVDLLG